MGEYSIDEMEVNLDPLSIAAMKKLSSKLISTNRTSAIYEIKFDLFNIF